LVALEIIQLSISVVSDALLFLYVVSVQPPYSKIRMIWLQWGFHGFLGALLYAVIGLATFIALLETTAPGLFGAWQPRFLVFWNLVMLCGHIFTMWNCHSLETRRW